MESHVLNIYHHARYRTMDHKIMHSTSESEVSCNQNSPEYSQEQTSSQYEEASNVGQYWNAQNRNLWSHNQKINITKSSNDSSMDDEEIIDVQDISVDEKPIDSSDEEIESESIEDNSLVEGADYDVIQVFAVDPDLDLEGSSEDEEQDEKSRDEELDNESEDEEEFCNQEDKTTFIETDNSYQQNSPDNIICENSLGINLDTPVVSNVDDYFIKDKDILAVKDEPVVKDVDEYFIKNTKKPMLPTVEEDLLITAKLPDEPDFKIQKDEVHNIDEFFTVENVSDGKCEIIKDIMPDTEPELPINEFDLNSFSNIEDLKRYLLEDMPYNKLKNAQRSCSAPHSPMHNLCLDLDSKTCLSLEDLNLDLSDLSFDNSKDKSKNISKNDDIPQTLTEEDVNSFLITPSSALTIKDQDDLIPQDMEIDKPLDSIISSQATPVNVCQYDPIETIKSSLEKISAINTLIDDKQIVDKEPMTLLRPIKATPMTVGTSSEMPKSPKKIESTVFDFCIEKKNSKKGSYGKIETDDFVDVESCNDTVVPVLEANSLKSLLEQFEATENLNKKTKLVKVETSVKTKPLTSLTNGMRLQDAGVQLNKNKMRQILIRQPLTTNTKVKRSPSPVHSDHDYCSTKKRHSLPNIKGGRSLLKPEVLSSNNKILSSRHRSCKNKRILYHQSSDEESEKCSDIKKTISSNRNNTSFYESDIKKKCTSKESLKKLSPVCFVTNNIDKNNDSVMVKNASKASDTVSSQNSNGSIKLTIKNKSEVIIRHFNAKDMETTEKCSSVEKYVERNNEESFKKVTKISGQTDKKSHPITKIIEPSNKEDFYVKLFQNKKDVQIPVNVTKNTIKRSHDEIGKISPESMHGVYTEMPQKKKKLNLQEYKLRRENNSNQSSAQVSPEAIFPEMPCIINKETNNKPAVNNKPCDEVKTKIDDNSETVKKIFDPIREASRKILMNSKKSKAEASRKRDEDFVMSKIPKVVNLELQPLISDAEMMKIVSMSDDPILSISIPTPNAVALKPHKNYDEIILVSVATNTDDEMFKSISESIPENKKYKMSPPQDIKSTINFKIKKSENILKHNVFESVKNDRIVKEEQTTEIKMDEERYKGITATLKSVEKQVDTRISSNSLFASIQDVVMKKATSVQSGYPDYKQKFSSICKQEFIQLKPTIVRDYDENAEHGEDKVILHLEKSRNKPEANTVTIQTDYSEAYKPLTLEITKQEALKEQSISPRKRNDSDMSMSSASSPERKLHKPKTENRRKDLKREKSYIEGKRSRSKDRHDVKYRRSRSHSRGHRRHRSRSRSQSRSRGKFKRYKRSDSPYRRKRRSRSPLRSPVRREYHSVRSGSRYAETKSSIFKKSLPNIEKNKKSLTPPIRKNTVSECSETTSSYSSSSSSAHSSRSSNSRRGPSTFRRNDSRANTYRASYSSEDRESNTPVEERRIVFVGRLEQNITKSLLRSKFAKFGPVTEVRLHSKEDGSRYGFVTYQRPRDAWTAVEAANTFPQYDVGFGGRRAFCRQTYADLDGLEAKYTESAFRGQAAAPPRRNGLSFDQMLLEVQDKINRRRGDVGPEDID